MTTSSRRFGLLGGLGPESTIVYYRRIFAEYQRRLPEGGSPPLLINTIDLATVLRLVGAGELAALADLLVDELQVLVRAGVEAAAIGANTPHLVFDEVQARVPIPLISIVEAACAVAAGAGYRRVGLIGTRFTMEARFFPDVFERSGIAVVTPGGDDKLAVDAIYRSELLAGLVLPASRARLAEVTRRLKASAGIDALLLGGTELSLILDETSGLVVPILDTTQVHVAAIVDWMVS